ncbi:MAG: SGNH/GDSL hydrolase family protein [Frankiaceae bacterium]
MRLRAEQPGSSGTRSATPRRPAGRRHLVALCVVAVLLNGVGLTGRSTASSAGPLRLVALGDSVPAGTACHCANFVALLGDRIAATLHRRVLVINDARPGEDSTGLRADLDGGSAIGDDVANTDVVVVNIGANDVSFNDYSDAGCAAEHTACYTTVFSMLRANLTAVVHRISALRHGQDTQVVVVGYWNTWQDGSVGEAKGREFQQVSGT